MAAFTRSGARKASEIVMLTFRMLHRSRLAMLSAFAFTSARSSSSQRRCVYRKLDSVIVVMKAAKDGRRYEAAHMQDGAMDRSVFVERPMSPQLVIVGGILCQNSA